jgi:CHAT domain-containing protein/Tfp pilus assembly protein PilF
MIRTLAIYCIMVSSSMVPTIQIQAGIVGYEQEKQRSQQSEAGKATEGESAGDQTKDERDLREARELYAEFVRLFRAGKYDEARPFAEHALEIRERVLGKENRDVAQALNALAAIHSRKGEFASAEPIYQRVLAIMVKSLGADHTGMRTPLNNLALLYYRKGDYASAEPLYQRALAIAEKTLGPGDPDIADILDNLALLYKKLGRYTKAEPLSQRALAIREKALGPENPQVADSLKNLASLYREVGDFAAAEPLFQRALAIMEKTAGPENPMLAETLNNFGNFYRSFGDFEKAEALYLRALNIAEKALGQGHVEIARYLSNLASLYPNGISYDKAESLYQRALTIRETVLGPDHPDFADTLQYLAHLHIANGNYEKAEPLLRRSLPILEKAMGKEHPNVALALNLLAGLKLKSGDYAQAESLYQRSLEIMEKSWGRENPNLTGVLFAMARLYAARGDIPEAVRLLSRTNAIDERTLERNLFLGSERQKLAYLDLFTERIYYTLSFQTKAAAKDPQALDLAFTTLLRRKGRGLDAMTDSIATLRRHATPQDQALLDQLADERAELAALTLGVPQAAKPDIYRTRLEKLREKIEALEAELSTRSADFRRQQMRPVTITAVQAALTTGSALVEFAFFKPIDPTSGANARPRYLAYLLTAQGQPKWVDLGEAALIDRAVNHWREALRDPDRNDVKQLARAVDERVMRPVRALLSDYHGATQRLLIAPDGSLNLIPFAALVDERNQYLIERYSISYLTSGRDLLRLHTPETSGGPPLVVANPDFGGFATVASRRSLKHARSPIDPGRIIFQPLPATEDEALAIKELLPATSVLRREEATETALKRVISPQILHIATHGFFLNNSESDQAKGEFPSKSAEASLYTVQLEATPALATAQNTVSQLKTQGINAYIVKGRVMGKGIVYRVRIGKSLSLAEARKYGAELKEKGIVSEFFVARYETRREGSLPGRRLSKIAAQVKNPLLRSGLALAGANQRQSQDDDGVLTALEAAYLDLSATKLVVLSACDTGVGEVKNGEGVQGLRRAFVLAGSESQVMSLWPVSDAATRDLMISYYKALQCGEGRGDGLRGVQLQMLRGRRGMRHPFYWAAFIESGEWANLNGKR